MPPSGPRSRTAQQPSASASSSRAPPQGNVRNQAFENIFGRPAGGHHLGPHPVPPGAAAPSPAAPAPLPQHHAAAAGYGGYGALAPAQPPPQAGGSAAYLNPAQPSYPPGMSMGYQPPPPRQPPAHPYPGQHVYRPQPQPQPHADAGYGRGYDAMDAGYGGRTVSANYPPPSERLRRSSLAPSTYSATSSASYYSPNPDALTMSPNAPSTGRVPSASFPTPQPVPARLPSGAYPAGAMTPAQAYQASLVHAQGGSANGSSSPASVVFPHRAGEHVADRSSGSSLAMPMPEPAPSHSSSSYATSSNGHAPSPTQGGRLPTSSSITSFHKPTSRSPPLSDQAYAYAGVADAYGGVAEEPLPERDGRAERSATPDYIGAMGNLSFESSPGKGWMDDVNAAVAGGSERGSRRGHGDDDSHGRTTSQPPSSTRPAEHDDQNRHGGASGMARASMHRRMASDSSIASSSGYTTKAQRNNIAPLSQIDASPVGATHESTSSPTTPTGSDKGYMAQALRRLSGRKSMESTISLPLPGEANLPPGAAPGTTRTTSFSGSITGRSDATLVARGSGSHHHHSGPAPPVSSLALSHPTSHHSLPETLHRNSSTARAAALSSLPAIYPALLSRVAEAFKQVITLSELVKDGITYKDSFDGRTAVAIIGDIIKTPDRNLALLLGRALDAQKFFHDVTYDHRLRDNPHEIYQFKERLAAPFMDGAAGAGKPGGAVGAADSPRSEHAGLARAPMHHSNSSTSFISPTPATSSTTLASPSLGSGGVGLGIGAGGLDGEEGEDDLPVGVFTLLTDCYSPTCSRDSLCYSINCPRRLEQMKRLNMKPQPGLTRKLSNESMLEVKETGTLWIHSVSQEILDSVDDTEKKRQEAINEVIYTERDFVRDLEYLRDSWVKPLRTQDIVDPARRDDFVRQVFWNVHDVLTVNHPLAERLTKRQKKEPVVSAIGDIFLERVPLFEPFVTYGAHQLFGKYEFEKEKGANPAFQTFVDTTERKPESRKLELNGYLTKPTTRLGRYPLLLQAVLKYTPDDHPDKKDLPEVIKMIKGFLTKVNVETGKSENIFELAQIEQQLVFRPNETIDLRLRDKNRELVHKGPLKRRGGSREEIADLVGFLFDHAFLLVKPKWVQKSEQYKVYRRPIPLELLVLATPDEHYNSGKLSSGRSRLIARQSGHKSGSGGSGAVQAPPKPESKHGFSITIIHLGKKGYSMQLWVDTYISRKKWLECIDKQQTILRERSCVFVSDTITDGWLGVGRKVNCSSPYDQGHRMIYGTDDGVYFSNLRDEKLRDPVKVIALLDVTQVDVIEEFQLLIVLHERCVTTFPLECLDPGDPNAALKRGKRISSHTSFIKSGVCLGKTLVAIVKSSTLSSTIKVMEPVDVSQNRKKAQGGFMKRLNGREDALKLFKEFYIPTESSSVHFLKTKLCVGCTKGFEIVDLETLDMQGLLDPSDASLDFVLKRDNVRPIAIYRIEEDFLLCYDEFAFYVNKNGWRSRPKWAIVWEGVPTSFALQYPYVIAFEPTFIEVHHVETGHLVQIIPGTNIQCLFADTPPSRVNAPTPAPSRMMYPGGASPYGPGRPPHQGGYPGQYPYPPPNQQGRGGYYPPPTAGGRVRPPMGAPYGMPPPPPVNRYARPQVVFVSEDSHVQFLKFPPPAALTAQRTGPGGVPAHAPRPSH
ncbi:hypothetical protein IAT38_007049 [Cryptococcus sp. DSM 104549]